MNYKVSLTQSALDDLYAIDEYYLAQVSDKVAENIFSNLQARIKKPRDLPERGTLPQELAVTGITRYRQVLSSNYLPYRRS